jgi:hypothetical protein
LNPSSGITNPQPHCDRITQGTVRRFPPKPECIRLRGVRQNNLKGFDLDVPLGRYVVVTGLSGAGKSSLVFETLHAEGQRRYVETFSAYTRQFLELLDKPRVDSIENIRPSIAIEQTNTVKSSRSTVGTMTELTDFFKVWFSHVAECFDPDTGEKVEDDNPQRIWSKTLGSSPGMPVIVAFEVVRPENLAWAEILASLKNQAYVRVLAAKSIDSDLAVHRVEDLLADPGALSGAGRIHVVQDRIAVEPASMARFTEAVETAMHFGRGEVRIFAADGLAELGHYSRGLHSPKTGRKFRPATPPLFSFNSPLGACPTCRGFGRVIDIDYRLAIPDPSLSIDDGALRCWEGAVYSASKDDLRVFTKRMRIPTDVPFNRLTAGAAGVRRRGRAGLRRGERQGMAEVLVRGEGILPVAGEEHLQDARARLPVALPLVQPVPGCGGSRLQPEALCWKWNGHTLPELYRMPVDRLLDSVGGSRPARGRTPGGARLRLDPHPPSLPARGRPRLPHARPAVPHALGRRGGARQPDGLPRHVAGGHAVRHGRAERRPPPEGHRPARGDHPVAGGRGQHRGRGRARRVDDPGGRPRDRDRARARRPRRPRRLPGDGGADAPGSREHHRGLFLGAAADREPPRAQGRHPGAPLARIRPGGQAQPPRRST